MSVGSEPFRPLPLIRLSPEGSTSPIERAVAVECPVAIEVDGFGYAVMMMTPERLEDFATGFLLTERLVDSAADILSIDPFAAEAGWIVRVTLAAHLRGRMQDRVRHRTSDTSCGLCGLSGLEQIARPVTKRPPAPRAAPATLFAALSGLRDHQPWNARTGAVHAAMACDAQGTVLAAAEDVGRHNALDKLVGTLAHTDMRPDFILVTSRISYEMVDKALVAGVGLLVGISAPTSLAIEHAQAHGLTLIALARADAMLVANDPHGIFNG
ncbi:formate dehydrogenase accessory sulfurtransferase FdhD [uncultured Sphingomonas sp.]|uniref:formate dehydrogenase accessory sulfurtransferase FdhD n=1 Tax=uncultured Sphingomonas sp. TaxID=158754 RepID=UPI0025F7FBCE|nr:formate dehydrogenase accessory sulfurtransferase FdhD [uncultured Sphingomonas sp.]